LGAGRVRDGRRHPRRRRPPHGLRQLHDHRALAPRGPRLLREGGGRGVRRRRQARPGRVAPDEHQRRRPLLHPSRHVRHVPHRRGGAPAARRVWRAPARRPRDRGRPRLGRAPLDDGNARPRHGGNTVKLFEPPQSEHGTPFWDATREERLVIPYSVGTGTPFWYPREAAPDTLEPAVEWREASGEGTVYAVSVQHKTGPGRDPADGPYAVALVDLPEGVRIMS